MSDVVTMDDLSNEEILSILDDSKRLIPVARGDVHLPLLEGKVLANMFYENSTRTRMSFETAMKRLGGSVLNFTSVGTSVAKGETLYDTMQMVDGYADIAVIRHPRQGALSTVPMQWISQYSMQGMVLGITPLRPCWIYSP